MMAKPVLKSLKSRSYRFVVVLLLLCTLLTFNVGRVYRVEAMATTAAIAGAALLGTGAIYLGYLAMTGASVSIPSGTGQDIQDYLTDVGRKVAYYGSGAAIYNKLYSFLRSEGVPALYSYDVTWTQNDLLDLYNDFKDISIAQGILSYSVPLSIYSNPTTNFDYSFTFTDIPDSYNGYPLSHWTEQGYQFRHLYNKNLLVLVSSGVASLVPIHDLSDMRNYIRSDGKYIIQRLVNGVWQSYTDIYFGDDYFQPNNRQSIYNATASLDGYVFSFGNAGGHYTYSALSYPPLGNGVIYDSRTGTEIEVIPLEDIDVVSPEYDDNDNYPVVPYVQLPDGGNWGFNLGDLISEIINRGSQVITAVGIGDLINQFMNSLGGDTGDYIYYSDNDNNYYIYYSNVYQGDDYTTYNINVGDQQEVIPVDLNTIQEYTDNVYLDTVKSSTLAFGSAIAEYFIFWHNSDPVLFYTLCGSFIVILIGAFIGKWGHS